MWDWIASQLDTSDVVILVLALAGAAYFLLKNRGQQSRYSPNVVPIAPTRSKDMSLIARMQSENRKVLILYGSQTGTAEELSTRLAKDLTSYSQKALVLDPEEIETDDLARLTEVENCLLVLCMATYGEGDPTDNSQALYEFLTTTDTTFSGVKYAVFGLGNKTYEHFNAVGKVVDKRLEELGAERVFTMGLGDDDANLEEDFMRWREAFLPKISQTFGWEYNMDVETQRQFRLELIPKDATVALFTGEYGRINAFKMQRAPFEQKNPFLATVAVNEELHTAKSERSCRHIEFAVEVAQSENNVVPAWWLLYCRWFHRGSRIRYEAGDHLAVYPLNADHLVDDIIRIVDCDPDQAFRLVNMDDTASKRHPFPCPCSYRTALRHYVDICAPLKSHVLKGISEYCSDEAEKARLQLLSTATEEGLKEYATYILKERRSIVDILKEHPSCRPPIEYLLELLPRLQARYYSIASSPKHKDETISVCAVVTKYSIGDREINGVCTRYLKTECPPGGRVAVYVRKSAMRLPHKLTTGVIMIGPGTGFAPFRGFIQDRAHYKKNMNREVGPMMLFYGCRHEEHDYIYREEIEQYVADGVITDLQCAFSRAQEHKVYVQNKLWDCRENVWKALEEGAHVYVCGDARNMARDVQATLLRIFQEVGGQSEDEANKMLKNMERQKRYQADVWS